MTWKLSNVFLLTQKKNVFNKALILNLGPTDLPLCNVVKQEHPSILSMSTARLIGKYWNNTCHKNSKISALIESQLPAH